MGNIYRKVNVNSINADGKLVGSGAPEVLAAIVDKNLVRMAGQTSGGDEVEIILGHDYPWP